MLDVIIIGGSAAATSAGIYAARRGLKVQIITKEFGGEVVTSGEIGNWPGDGMTDGITLAGKFKSHLEYYKVPIEEGVWVEKITKQEDGTFCISAKKDGPLSSAGEKMATQAPAGFGKCDYIAKSVIVATGVHPRELNIPGEKEFRGKGVTYCTTCDGPLFSGKVTTVVGGGNSALEAALMLADIAKEVNIINKNDQFKGDDVLIKNVSSKPNVKIFYGAGSKEIKGENFVKSIVYTDKNGKEVELPTDGVFVHIGMVPNSEIVPDEVQKNNFKEITVNARCETNIPGLFAAGDVTDVPFKQIVIASAQGCIAVLSAVQYLNKI